jgi:TRAP-type transport system small permease protein
MIHVTTLAVFLFRTAVGAAFLALMGAVLWQIGGRGGLLPAVVWTEEAARFCLLFIAAFGAGLALRSGDMVNVDLVSESLPGRWPWRMRLLAAAATLAMCAALVLPGWTFTRIGTMQTAPALGVSMVWIHAVVLILPLGLGLFALLRIVGMLTGADTGLPAKRDEEEA